MMRTRGVFLAAAAALLTPAALASGCGNYGEHYPPPPGLTAGTSTSTTSSTSSSSGTTDVDCNCVAKLSDPTCSGCFNTAGEPGPPEGTCRAANVACLADASCIAAQACIVACKFTAPCIDSCFPPGPPTLGVKRLRNLLKCVCTNCPSCEAPQPSYACTLNPEFMPEGGADAETDGDAQADGDAQVDGEAGP